LQRYSGDLKINSPLCGFVEDDGSATCHCWNLEGFFADWVPREHCQMDLYLIKKKKTIWVNLYFDYYNNALKTIHSRNYEDIKSTAEDGRSGCKFIKTIEVEI